MKSSTNRSSTTASVGLQRGRSAFNRGDYFQAHELWEDVWRDLDGVDKTVVQGLIQIAAGCHHLRNQRPVPAARLIAKGVDKLAAPTPALLIEMSVRALADSAGSLLAVLKSGGNRLPDPTVLRL